MRALQLTRFDPALAGLLAAELPKPEPRRGEVLVSIACAPVNPADMMMLSGRYVRQPEPPFVPGLVGVGRVVENRAGVLGRFLLGRRVVCAAAPGRGGTWAEFAVASPQLCFPASAALSDEEAVNLLANGGTVVGLFETLRRHGHRAVIFTAAAGEVGRMMNGAAGRHGVTLVNVVRSPGQARSLAEMGSKFVVDMSHPDYEAELSEVVRTARVRAAIDSVAGSMPELLMRVLPDGSDLWLLGRLSGEPVSFDGLEHLVRRRHTLRGFDVVNWFERQGAVGGLRAARKAQRILLEGSRTIVRARLTLDQAVAQVTTLAAGASAGKILILPGPVRSASPFPGGSLSQRAMRRTGDA